MTFLLEYPRSFIDFDLYYNQTQQIVDDKFLMNFTIIDTTKEWTISVSV